jgi:hypothetical protein
MSDRSSRSLRSLDSTEDRRRSRSQLLNVELNELNLLSLLSREFPVSIEALWLAEVISGGELDRLPVKTRPDIVPGAGWPGE